MKQHLCKSCGETDSIKFYKNRKSLCKKCVVIKENNRYKNDPILRSYRREAYLKFEREKLLQVRWLGAKSRAFKKGIDFTITLTDLELLRDRQNNKCYYTGIEFNNDNSGVTSISIDRIDSSGGYTIDNIRLVCTLVNKMKSDRTEEGFLNCVRDIYHHMRLDRV